MLLKSKVSATVDTGDLLERVRVDTITTDGKTLTMVEHNTIIDSETLGVSCDRGFAEPSFSELGVESDFLQVKVIIIFDRNFGGESK